MNRRGAPHAELRLLWLKYIDPLKEPNHQMFYRLIP